MSRANPWTPWMAWADAAMAAGDMAVASSQVIAQRGARMAKSGWPLVPLGARDAKEFTLMGTEKMQAAGEAALAMLSPLLVNSGALMMRLSQMAWQQTQRNLNFIMQFSPRLVGAGAAKNWRAPDWTAMLPFGPPSAWSEAPLEAAVRSNARAMADAVQQTNYLTATAGNAARAAAHVSTAGAKAVKRAIKPVRAKAKANARRLSRR